MLAFQTEFKGKEKKNKHLVKTPPFLPQKRLFFYYLLTVMIWFLEKDKQNCNYILIIACKMPQKFFGLFFCAKRRICSWENVAEFQSTLFRGQNSLGVTECKENWALNDNNKKVNVTCGEQTSLNKVVVLRCKLTPSTHSWRISPFFTKTCYSGCHFITCYVMQRWKNLLNFCFHYSFLQNVSSYHVNIKKKT